MRVLPTVERSEEDIRARQVFEQYSSIIQASKISVAISAVSGAIAGGTKAGPIGAAAGAVLGALVGYWKRKTYRIQAYVGMKSQGLLQKRRIGRRDLWSLQTAKFAFVRLPYAELTALVIVPILQRHYPDMNEAELVDVGHRTQRTLITFRKQYLDIPIELAAEAILAFYGIIREPGQDYDLAWMPTPGEPYQPPPEGQIPMITTTREPIPADKDAKSAASNYWIYLALIVAVLIVVTW